jgi:hypothetical protein
MFQILYLKFVKHTRATEKIRKTLKKIKLCIQELLKVDNSAPYLDLDN